VSVALRDLERRLPEPDKALAQRIMAEVAPPARARRPLRWAGIAAVAALVIGSVVVAGLLRRASERHSPAKAPVVHHGLAPLRHGDEVAVGDTHGIWAVDPNSGLRRLLVPEAEIAGSQYLDDGRWSPDGTRFVFSTRKAIYVKETGRPARRVDARWAHVIGPWSPDGSAVLIDDHSGGAAILDTATLKVQPLGVSASAGLAWVDGGRSLLTVENRHHEPPVISRFDPITRRWTIVWTAQPPIHSIGATAASASGASVAIVLWDFRQWQVAIFDPQRLRPVVVGDLPLGHTASPPPVVWSPDGTRLAVAGGVPTRVWIVEAPTRQARPLHVHGIHGGIELAFSPDGTWLAVFRPPWDGPVAVRIDGTDQHPLSNLVARSWVQSAP
jgi:hypothetical protein